MSVPTRIQRLRLFGSQTPTNTRYCGRPGPFGNPFATKAEFEVWMRTGKVDGLDPTRQAEFDAKRLTILANLSELYKYKYLSCWCGLEQDCHVDVIIELLHEHRRSLHIARDPLRAAYRGESR